MQTSKTRLKGPKPVEQFAEPGGEGEGHSNTARQEDNSADRAEVDAGNADEDLVKDDCCGNGAPESCEGGDESAREDGGGKAGGSGDGDDEGGESKGDKFIAPRAAPPAALPLGTVAVVPYPPGSHRPHNPLQPPPPPNPQAFSAAYYPAPPGFAPYAAPPHPMYFAAPPHQPPPPPPPPSRAVPPAASAGGSPGEGGGGPPVAVVPSVLPGMPAIPPASAAVAAGAAAVIASVSSGYIDASSAPDPVPDNRRNRGGVTEPFPEKLHRMLEYAEARGMSDVAAFLPHGRAFAIRKPKRFVDEVMTKFFRQTRLTSFQRQLNLYGFRRISQGPDTGGYFHELFLKGRPGLCVNMQRTKVKGENAVNKIRRDPDAEPNFYSMPPISAAVTTEVAPIVMPAYAAATATSAAGSPAAATGAGGPIAPAPKMEEMETAAAELTSSPPKFDAASPREANPVSTPDKSAVPSREASASPVPSAPPTQQKNQQLQQQQKQPPMQPQPFLGPYPPPPASYQHPPPPYGYYLPPFQPALIHPAPYTAAQMTTPHPTTSSAVAPTGGVPPPTVPLCPQFPPYPGYPYYQYPWPPPPHGYPYLQPPPAATVQPLASQEKRQSADGKGDARKRDGEEPKSSAVSQGEEDKEKVDAAKTGNKKGANVGAANKGDNVVVSQTNENAEPADASVGSALEEGKVPNVDRQKATIAAV